MRHRPFRLAPLAAALAAVAVPVAAANHAVTNNLDAGAGSLREAIAKANANCGSEMVSVLPTAAPFTLVLDAPLPALACNTAVSCPKGSKITLNDLDVTAQVCGGSVTMVAAAYGGPDSSLTPPSLSFGDVPVGAMSPSQNAAYQSTG